MKTARFLFVMAVCRALTLGAGHAGEPASQPSKQAPPALKKAAIAAAPANNGLVMNKLENHREQPAKLPAGGMTGSRSATLAVLGGATASSAKHPAAVIDGSAMKHKP